MDEQGFPELRPAKINDRFLAYLIDSAPFVCGYYWSLARVPRFPLKMAAAWAGLYIGYQFAGNLRGATLGKKLMGLAVVGADGGPLGAARSFLRAVGSVVSTPLCNFGYVLALFHPESRALHDLVAGSLVVEAREKRPAESWLLFLAAFAALIILFAGPLLKIFNAPTAADLRAVERAREGLASLAQLEESYKAANGTYTDSLIDLAQTSGDAAGFNAAVERLFDTHGFAFRAGNKRFRIEGAALDKKRTRVAIEGP